MTDGEEVMEWVISLVEGKEKKKWRNCGQAINVMQGRRNGRTLGASAPQCLAEQLTLSQPGGQIMPTTVLQGVPTRYDIL